MAGDGGGNPRRRGCKILILLGSPESALDCSITSPASAPAAPSRPTGRSLYRKCLWAKGFHLKAVALQLLGDAREIPPSARLQFHQQGISNLWRCTFSTCRSRKIFSKSTRSCATCWSMIHNPSSPEARMNDSRNCPGGERAQVVQVGGRLLGLNLGGGRLLGSQSVCRAPLRLGCSRRFRESGPGWKSAAAASPHASRSKPAQPPECRPAPWASKGQLAGNGSGCRGVSWKGSRIRGRAGKASGSESACGNGGGTSRRPGQAAKAPAASAMGWRAAASRARPEIPRPAAP
jgi:hypothetical protein